MIFNVSIIVNDMVSHRVHTFIVPRLCSILAWWWLFTAETCCQNFKMQYCQNCWLIFVVFLDGNKILYRDLNFTLKVSRCYRHLCAYWHDGDMSGHGWNDTWVRRYSLLMKTQNAYIWDNVHSSCNDIYVELHLHISRTAEHLLFTIWYCGIDLLSLSSLPNGRRKT